MESLHFNNVLPTHNEDEYSLAERISTLSASDFLQKHEIEKVRLIRQNKRNELKYQRKIVKDEKLDERRLLNMPENSVNVVDLAKKLKSKVEVEDLRTLKNLLLDDENNIKLVLSQEGALRGIVRELTGRDVKRQQEAAGILCNLALGQNDIVHVISKVACVYLTITLESQNEQLAVLSAWTLGNMCGAGTPSSVALRDGGAAPALCRLARTQPEPAVYALTLYATAMQDLMSTDHLEMLIEATYKIRCVGVFRLFHTLSCHSEFNDHGRLESAILENIEKMMIQHDKKCGTVPDCCELVYAIRTLSQLTAPAHRRVLTYICQSRRKELFTSLVHDERLKPSMLWFFGNVHNCTIQEQSEESKHTEQSQVSYKNYRPIEIHETEAME